MTHWIPFLSNADLSAVKLIFEVVSGTLLIQTNILMCLLFINFWFFNPGFQIKYTIVIFAKIKIIYYACIAFSKNLIFYT